MLDELLGAGSQVGRRNHDASRTIEDAPEKGAIEQTVLPTRPQHLAVEPHHERSALTREKVGRQRQRIRFVNDREVALGTRESERERRADANRSDGRDAGDARDRHAVHRLMDGERRRVRGQYLAGDERLLALTQQLDDALHPAGCGGIVLADVEDVGHEASRARAAASRSRARASATYWSAIEEAYVFQLNRAPRARARSRLSAHAA